MRLTRLDAGIAGAIWLLVVALCATLTPSAHATKGNRIGCLAVFNKSQEALLVYVTGTVSGDDGYWGSHAGSHVVLANHDKDILVDEDTIVWAVSSRGEYPKLTLLTDPGSSGYFATTRPGCPYGWLKTFI